MYQGLSARALLLARGAIADPALDIAQVVDTYRHRNQTVPAR